MLPRQLRVGDLVDDYCPRERRLSNHAVVALVGDEIRQVRCTTCDAEHEYRGGKVPVSRKKQPAVAPPALSPAAAAESAGSEEGGPPPAAEPQPPSASPAVCDAGSDAEEQPTPAPSPHAEISLHRRLIRATLPRVEGDTPARPIPEFTMHRTPPAGHGHRHGKPFRHGQGGGQHRPSGKGGFGHGRHGQGEANGNTLGPRGGHGQRGGHGTHGGPGSHGGHGGHGLQRGHGAHGHQHGPRPSRHGFGGKPPRGPKKP